MILISALLSGLLFGAGLILSGMTNPAKVTGFLDIAGLWDPSLMFVMVGAIAVAFLPFRRIRQTGVTLTQQPVSLPTKQQFDKGLVLGSLVFGVGWGLAGYCPGPALTSLLTGSLEPLLFVLAMLVGMACYALTQNMFNPEQL